MDDNQLMRRLTLGDTEALTELITRHRPWAEQLAYSMLRDHAAAEDVVQEAFARVYLLRQRYQPTFTFKTWLSVMVRRLCIDQYRRNRHAPELPGELPEELTDSAESLCLQKEQRMALWSSLQALQESDGKLLIGYSLEGMSYQQLANQYHMSLSNVKVRLHRIRKQLQKHTAKERDW